MTLNCLVRDMDAVREVARFKPDIVFIQEAPAAPDLRRFARELWGDEGSSIGSYYCAILARGRLIERPRITLIRTAGARLQLVDGGELELMCVHLQHATTRWDLWRRSCWREHRDIHRKRRDQLQEFFAELESHRGAAPAILAGDFNAPPTSNVFDLVPDGYANAFGVAGRGLGNTFLNGFPVLRIDHIYASDEFTVSDARAARTVHSDHRMVVADLLLAR